MPDAPARSAVNPRKAAPSRCTLLSCDVSSKSGAYCGTTKGGGDPFRRFVSCPFCGAGWAFCCDGADAHLIILASAMRPPPTSHLFSRLSISPVQLQRTKLILLLAHDRFSTCFSVFRLLFQVAGSIIGKGGSNISKLRTEVSGRLPTLPRPSLLSSH